MSISCKYKPKFRIKDWVEEIWELLPYAKSKLNYVNGYDHSEKIR